jgi:hypothetical protein
MKWHGLKAVAASLAVLALLGCGKSQEQSDAGKTAEPEVASAPQQQPAQSPATTTTPTTSQPATQQPAQQPTQKPAQQKPASDQTAQKPAPKEPETPKMVSIPTGTTLVVALETHLRTDSNEIGDPFTARTTEAIRLGDATVIPAGTEVRGKLTHVEEPHRTAGKAQLTLAFEQIVDGTGKAHDISVAPMVLEAEGDKVSDEEKVAAGAVVGGIIGALTSKKKTKGAATGAVAGAAAGGAIALATKGKQLDLPPGQQFSIELTAPVEVPASQLTAGK